MADIQRENEAALVEFYNLTKSKVFATILMIIAELMIIADRQSAEDIVQEVYVRIWNKGHYFDPTKSSGG